MAKVAKQMVQELEQLGRSLRHLLRSWRRKNLDEDQIQRELAELNREINS